jgi:hypothetical protein
MNLAKISVSGVVSLVVSISAFASYPVVVTKITDPQHTVNIVKTATETAATAARTAQVVQQAQTLVAFAGDPKAAVRNLSDLERINQSVKRIVGPEAGADSLLESGRNIMQANSEFTRARREIEVLGQRRNSAPSLYEALDAAEALSQGVKEQLRRQQDARKTSAEELEKAQQGLKNAATESEKQAAAAQMQAIAAQQAIMNGQVQQQALEIQIQQAEQARREKEARIRAEAEFNARAAAAREQQDTRKAQDTTAGRETFKPVDARPPEFDWEAIR